VLRTTWNTFTPAQKKAAAAVAVLIVAWGAWRGGQTLLALTKTPPDTSTAVVVGTVTARDVPLYIEGIGTVRAYNTVTVRPRVDGQLISVAFQEGQMVKKGDLLAQIDPHQYQSALDSARATMAGSQAALANAKRDLARYEELAANGYATHQQLDLQIAKAKTAEATAQADKARAHSAEIMLGYTTITSPLDGRTGIRRIDAGNIVHASDETGLVVITQLQPISIIFTVSQNDLPRLMHHTESAPFPITIFSSDGATELDQGVLELVDNTVDPATGTVRLKARSPNESQRLWPGEFVKVRMQTGTMPQGMVVSQDAVTRGPKGPFAYVVTAEKTVEMRSLELGPSHNNETVILSGVKPGETIVLEGQIKLAPGMKVKIAETRGSASGKDVAQSATDAATGAGNKGAGGAAAR